MKTFSAKSEEVKREWCVIDAENETLGRLASFIAKRLRGKHKAIFTPHADTGDNIVVINAEKIKVTGDKKAQKTYWRHSTRPGSMVLTTLGKMLETKPTTVIEKAVKGMMPKGPLGRQAFKKLKVYAGSEHPHIAQQPVTLKVEG